jgi:uncharacterized membrane protein YphA (DoxX/SURF4 family)
MNKRNMPSGKAHKIIYWIATGWLALGMLSTGMVQLLKVPDEVNNITELGYPVYFLTIIGVWKILAVVAVLVPRFPLLKEWAYAGMFFVMSGATFSRIASGDTMAEIAPTLLLLLLIVVSWYFRPVDRKLVSVTHQIS